MIKKTFFDTDCLSSFLWVGRADIVVNCFEKIIIPKQVECELSKVGAFAKDLKALKRRGTVEIAEIMTGSEEARLYAEMTSSPIITKIRIGSGEAAGIALAKVRGGCLASNNLKDVSVYIKAYGIELVTTADIFEYAEENNMLTTAEIEVLWKQMVAKRRKLPASTYAEYLKNKKCSEIF